MRSFCACFSGEFKKLAARKKYIVLSIISAVLCAVFALLTLLVGRISNADTAIVPAIPTTVLPVFTQLIIPLIAAMATCDLFASEYHDRSIRAVLMRPVTRIKVYVAKLLSVFAMCTAIIMFIFAVSAIFEMVLFSSFDGLFTAFLMYLLDLIPLFILILMTAMINQFTKGSTSAMFLCIIIYMLAKVVGVFAPILDSLMFTGYMQWHKLWLGSMLPIGALFAKCVLLLGYGITFFSSGYFMFLKREY